MQSTAGILPRKAAGKRSEDWVVFQAEPLGVSGRPQEAQGASKEHYQAHHDKGAGKGAQPFWNMGPLAAKRLEN